MSDQIVQAIIDRYVSDEQFRNDLRADPEGAISKAGFDLSEDDRALLKSIDFTQTDEQLHERLAAGGYGEMDWVGV